MTTNQYVAIVAMVIVIIGSGSVMILGSEHESKNMRACSLFAWMFGSLIPSTAFVILLFNLTFWR